MTGSEARPYRSVTNDSPALPEDREEFATSETAEIEGVEVSTDHWIGGERVGFVRDLHRLSPIDEQPIAEVARGGADEATPPSAAARAGFERLGRRCRPKERAEMLHRVADLVEERVPELAAVETRDNGSLLRSMRNSVMPRVARNFRFFADQLAGAAASATGLRRVRRARERGTRPGSPS